MKKNVTFYWDEQLDRLFQVSKDEIIRQSIEGVKAYDLQKPTCLATDWCKTLPMPRHTRPQLWGWALEVSIRWIKNDKRVSATLLPH